ncbi:MAG TPA: cysteine desulfurase [Planctomycetota bacterium]|nr:cysteine desulfurase [Planctomycetota bacterium]
MSAPVARSAPAYDVERIRRDFPILATRVRGKPLVYLDNAATTQKPRPVLEAVSRYYTSMNANIHRGVHYLSELGTRAYEDARARVARFLGTPDPREIVFVRGATEAINLVAHSFGRAFLREGDEILVTRLEHHSNIVPWQILREEKGIVLRVVPIDDRGELILEDFERMLTPRTKLVSVAHVSNALGTILPVARIVRTARERGIPVLVDGAQAVAHLPVNVRDLGCDFYVFSGHKLYGPTGVGVLWARAEHLERMPPYQGGGEMILSVSFERTEYNRIPHKFEAGTPHIEGVVGLAPALDYLAGLGLEAIGAHERDLLEYATEALSEIPGLRLLGTAREKSGVISFTLDGVHPHDVGTILDQEGVAIRTGHHCAQPVMERFGVPATARASFGLYNTRAEVDALVAALRKVRAVFRT